MIIYIVMLTISLLFCFLSLKVESKKRKNVYAVLSSIPFIVVAGLRYNVGTDYMFRYVPDYISITNGNIVENVELLFLILIKLCILITHDYWLLFFISSFITFGLIFKTIYSESKNKMLSILLLFVSSIFFISLNLMRQYISIAILYSTYTLLIKDKKIEWVISVIIASLFHTVSLLFLLAYFIKKKRFNIYIYSLIVLFIIIFGRSFVNFSISLFSKFNVANLRKYAAYINIEGNFTWSYFLTESFVLFYYLSIVYFKKIKTNSLENLYINCQYLVILFSMLNIYNELFLRMAFIFSIFQLSGIPYFYYRSCKLKTKRYINDIINSLFNPKVLIIMIIILFSFRLIYSNIIKNTAEVFPYQTIFERGEV